MILHIKSYSVNCFFRFPGSIQIKFSEILVQLSNLFLALLWKLAQRYEGIKRHLNNHT